MAKEAKRPKATDAVKEKLESYAALQQRIDNQKERLNTLKASIGPSTPNLTGMPSGGGNKCSAEERYVTRLDDIESRIRRMEVEERALYAELEAMIDGVKCPDGQTVLQMRYLDGQAWWTICAALFASNPDYMDNKEKYLKRI